MGDPDYEARKELARANRSFYQAFEKLDLEAMHAVWSAGPEVRCVHPGGEVLVGPERVLASWAAIMRSTVRIRFHLSDTAIEVLGDTGWVTTIERIETRVDEEVHTSDAAATNLFVRRDGRWWMVLHHASPIARRFFRE